jgi:hypothetical protein
MLQGLNPVLLGGPSHRWHSPALPRTLRTDEAAALPSPVVVLSVRLNRYYGRLRRPPGPPPTSRCRPVIGRDAPTAISAGCRAGEGLPSSRRHPLNVPRPLTPRSSSRLPFQDLHRFHGLRREPPGSALPRYLTTRQASHPATDRSVAPPTGLSTLGFDPARFQTRPPACYRASWQLPGRDSHPQAATSLCWISYSISHLQRWAHSQSRCK